MPTWLLVVLIAYLQFFYSHGREEEETGVTVNIHSPKKALSSTYLLANKHSPVIFSKDKKTPGSVYLQVNKYCLRKYVLPFS